MKERKIEIMEVCPRDGWQNLPDVIPLEKKKQYIDHMLASGVKYMQICSFVNPKVIPQMADAQEVTRYFLEKYPDRCFNALIPNLRGAQTAVDCGLREVSFVVSASESHNMANVKRTIAQSLAALDEICEKLPQLDVTLSIATSFGCPFEGAVPPEKVLEMVRHGVDIGITKVELADTIGVGDPMQVYELFRAVKERYPQLQLLAHMHDTRNNGVTNSFAAALAGADVIHGALGGLGGCPFAPGASGNTATEDLVFLMEKSGFRTGIDFPKLLEAAKEMRAEVPGNYSGHQIMIQSVPTGA